MRTGRTILYRFVRSLSVLAFVMIGGWLISHWVSVGINITDSLEGRVFIILKWIKPEKGDLAAFYPPPNEFFSRHYFVKFISGIAGDRVVREGRRFYIDDGQARTLIGDAKRFSKSGVRLQAAREGTIPDGHVFVSTPHRDSFDSRYAQIAWVPEHRIFGRAIRLL